MIALKNASIYYGSKNFFRSGKMESELRKAYHHAKFNENSLKGFALECLLLSALVGLYFKSVGWCVAVFFASMILIQFKAIRLILAFVFIAFWSVVFFSIGKEYN